MVERQWNPANEKQCEDRLCRIGQNADQVNAVYIIALRSIDEDLTELIEQKRQWIGQSLGDVEGNIQWHESDIIKELMRMTAQRRR